MRHIWQSLHATLSDSIRTLTASRRFDAPKRRHPALGRFADAPAVLDVLHDRDGDPDVKDRILAALVAAAQSDDAEAQFAMTMLWLALWPALDAVYRRLSRHFRDASDDLVSEIAGQFTVAVGRADVRRIRRVAATLVRNTERDIRARLRRSWREQAVIVPLDDGAHGHGGSGDAPDRGGVHMSPLGLPSGIDFDRQVAVIRDQLVQVVGPHADLVMAVVIFDEPQNRVADRLGISEAAGRKRYQRALRQLREEYAAA